MRVKRKRVRVKPVKPNKSESDEKEKIKERVSRFVAKGSKDW